MVIAAALFASAALAQEAGSPSAPQAASESFEGILGVVWGDPGPYAIGGATRYTLTLRDGTTVSLQLEGQESSALRHFGRRVRLSGRRLGTNRSTTSNIVVDAITPDSGIIPFADPATLSSAVVGTKKVLYLLLKYADDTAVPHPPQFYDDLNNPDIPPQGAGFPSTVNGFFKKTSWGQFHWIGDVGGVGGVPASGSADAAPSRRATTPPAAGMKFVPISTRSAATQWPPAPLPESTSPSMTNSTSCSATI